MIFKECGWGTNKDTDIEEYILIFYEYNNGSVEETNFLYEGDSPDFDTVKFYSNGIVEVYPDDFFCIDGSLLSVLGVTEEYDLLWR